MALGRAAQRRRHRSLHSRAHRARQARRRGHVLRGTGSRSRPGSHHSAQGVLLTVCARVDARIAVGALGQVYVMG